MDGRPWNLAEGRSPRCGADSPQRDSAPDCFGFTVVFMALQPPVVLTVAGFDPSSGAGITADIKTIAAHECYGVSCITALTVQSTQGVRRVVPVQPRLVVESLLELLEDIEVDAVHIG